MAAMAALSLAAIADAAWASSASPKEPFISTPKSNLQRASEAQLEAPDAVFSLAGRQCRSLQHDYLATTRKDKGAR